MSKIKTQLNIIDITGNGKMPVEVKYDKELDHIHKKEYEGDIDNNSIAKGIAKAIREQYDPEYTTVEPEFRYVK